MLFVIISSVSRLRKLNIFHCATYRTHVSSSISYYQGTFS